MQVFIAQAANMHILSNCGAFLLLPLQFMTSSPLHPILQVLEATTSVITLVLGMCRACLHGWLYGSSLLHFDKVGLDTAMVAPIITGLLVHC